MVARKYTARMATGRATPSSRVHEASEQAALAILRRLRERGHTAYLAGGCVRDTLLGLSPSDFDVATSALPDEVLALFEDSHAVGKAFGVVLVRFGKGRLGEIAGRPSPSVSVEVATFRREGEYSDNRRPDTVDFCGPEEDARRRDFTINALFLDPLKPGSVKQQVIDLVGGLDDLREGVIRAVGVPADRLREDHLRALRAVRFGARFGFQIERGTGTAIREHARMLGGVSPERVGDELRRMLGESAAVEARRRAIGLLEELGLADSVFGERAADSNALPCVGVLPTSACFATVLLAWMHDRLGLAGRPADEVSAALLGKSPELRGSLVLSNEEIGAYRAAAEGLACLEQGWGDAAVAQRKRWAASAWFEGALALVSGRNLALSRDIQADRDRLAADGIGLAPSPLVSGEDLIREGLSPGPDFKGRLERAYDAQLEGAAPTRSAALRVAMEG